MKIAVVANCQVQPLAQALSALHQVSTVVAVPIHLHATKHFVKATESFNALIQDPNAIVLSFVNGERFNEYATAVLKQQLKQFYTLTNVYFSGLHPDITYLGDQGGRITGCLGDYHSKIILHSFLIGLSKTDCLARFCGQEYEKLGYFDEFSKSAAKLRQRDQDIDIAFAEHFLAMLTEVPCLYTLNHPTAAVFQEYTAVIGQQLGLTVWRQPIALLNNYLGNNVWWPIYDEIAETHGLRYRTPCVFKQPDILGGKHIPLLPLIEAYYQHYANIETRLKNSRQVVALLNEFSR